MAITGENCENTDAVVMVFHARSERLTPRVAVYSLRVRYCKVCEPFGWIGRRWHLLAMLSQIFSLVCPSNPDPLVTELQTSTSVTDRSKRKADTRRQCKFYCVNERSIGTLRCANCSRIKIINTIFYKFLNYIRVTWLTFKSRGTNDLLA